MGLQFFCYAQAYDPSLAAGEEVVFEQGTCGELDSDAGDIVCSDLVCGFFAGSGDGDSE